MVTWNERKKELRQKLGRVTQEQAEDYVENYLKPATPVRTGFLRDSWRIRQLLFKRIQVFTSTFYAGFVEFGTSKMAPRAMVRSSFAAWKRSRK